MSAARSTSATARVAAVGVLAAGLVVLTLAVRLGWGPLADLDGCVASSAYDATAGHQHRVGFWTWVTTWGGPSIMRALLVFAGVVLASCRRYDLAVWLVALALVEAVAAPAAKLVLGRPRPHWAEPIAVVGSTSFPSGHATAAATAAAAALLLATSLSLRRSWSVAVSSAVWVVAAAVAASRVFLGVHYLSDVVGGLLLGALLALLTHELVGRLWRTRGPSRGRP
jgi:undecaprenyl-diphosphatase